jgi:DhnA family fructose-bisphosphate aldolase class Ia
MNVGKLVRLNRLFSHPSGRLCSVAVDHLIGYSQGMPPGLLHIKETLAAIMVGRPDAVTMHKGMAASAWLPYAGSIPDVKVRWRAGRHGSAAGGDT